MRARDVGTAARNPLPVAAWEIHPDHLRRCGWCRRLSREPLEGGCVGIREGPASLLEDTGGPAVVVSGGGQQGDAGVPVAVLPACKWSDRICLCARNQMRPLRLFIHRQRVGPLPISETSVRDSDTELLRRPAPVMMGTRTSGPPNSTRVTKIQQETTDDE